MAFPTDPAVVYRDFETDGVPSSGNHAPKKAEIRRMHAERDAAIAAGLSNGGLIYDTKANMDADKAHAANSSAWVIGDGTVANNGIYRKTGASGSGSWARIGDLPYSFIRASNAGAGTANAIKATTSIPIPAADGAALISVNVTAANSGPVTVSFNGEPPLTIKTGSGNDVVVGGLIAGMIVAGYRSGSTFRLLSDQASAALVAQAEDAANRAEAAAAGLNMPTIHAGDAGKQLAVKGDTSGYELVSTARPGFSSTGDIPAQKGFFKDDAPDTQIHRFRDRVFFGDGVKYTGNRQGVNGYGGSWLTEKGASYFEKNSQVTVLGDESVARYGLLGAAIGPSAIGIAAVAVNENGGGGRALYAEVFHKGTATASSGAEIQIGNYTSTNFIPNAYNMSGARALYLGCESGLGYTVGDTDTPIARPTHPAAAAIDIAGGTESNLNAFQRFHAGIVFRANALYRSGDGVSTGVSTAISLAERHQIRWQASASIVGATIRSDVTAIANQAVGIYFKNSSISFGGNGERPILNISDVANAVNNFAIENAAAGSPVRLSAQGSDENIDIRLGPKGTGLLQIGTTAPLATTPTAFAASRYLPIKDATGTIHYIPCSRTIW